MNNLIGDCYTVAIVQHLSKEELEQVFLRSIFIVVYLVLPHNSILTINSAVALFSM